jgi:hypothetical protein
VNLGSFRRRTEPLTALSCEQNIHRHMRRKTAGVTRQPYAPGVNIILDNESGEDFVGDDLGLDLLTSLRDISTHVVQQFIPPADMIPIIGSEGLRLTASSCRIIYPPTAIIPQVSTHDGKQQSIKQKLNKADCKVLEAYLSARLFNRERALSFQMFVCARGRYMFTDMLLTSCPIVVSATWLATCIIKTVANMPTRRGKIWETLLIGSGLRLHPGFWPCQISDLPHSYLGLAIGQT